MGNLQDPYARLIILSDEYREIIRRSQDTTLAVEDRQILSSERTVLHDAIIEEFERVGYPVTDRNEARQRALNIRAWLQSARQSC